jgi:hypothetical protein
VCRRRETNGGVGPALEQGKDHGCVANENCDEGFADRPLAGFGGFGGADLWRVSVGERHGMRMEGKKKGIGHVR